LSTFLLEVYVPSRIELAERSIQQMAISIRAFEKWAGRPLSLADLSEDLLRRFLSAYRKSHSPATTNSKRCQLLALWQCAFDEELLDRPPRRRKVRRCRDRTSVPEAWTPEEVGLVISSACEDTTPIAGIEAPIWWRSYLLALYDTGARRSAMLAVETADLDLDSAQIVLRNTKTGKHRWCKLAADTVAACRLIYDPSRRLVWPWHASREALDKRLRKILQRAGVRWGRGRGGSLHKMRRTSGTLVEQAGGDGAWGPCPASGCRAAGWALRTSRFTDGPALFTDGPVLFTEGPAMAWMILLAVLTAAVAWLRWVEAVDAKAARAVESPGEWTTPESLLRDDRHGG
jgi:integrase